MNKKTKPLVTDELVEFEIQPVEVQNLRKITTYLEESMAYTSHW